MMKKWLFNPRSLFPCTLQEYFSQEDLLKVVVELFSQKNKSAFMDLKWGLEIDLV